MTGARLVAIASFALCSLAATVAAGQDVQSVSVTATAAPTRAWLVFGGGSSTLLGDCTDCAADRYFHTGSLVVNAGYSLNRRTDFGAEVFWVPNEIGTGDRIRVTFVMAAVQFRPWTNHGFFLKTGAGMAFMVNFLDALEDASPPIRSKAFALGIGAGWEFPVHRRFGVQVYGSQHAAALGDLQTSVRTVENVMANFWSAGAAIVIR